VEKNLSIKQLYKHGRVAGGRGVGHSAAAGLSATRSSRSDASGAHVAAVRQSRLQQLYHRVVFSSHQPQPQPPTPTYP